MRGILLPNFSTSAAAKKTKSLSILAHCLGRFYDRLATAMDQTIEMTSITTSATRGLKIALALFFVGISGNSVWAQAFNDDRELRIGDRWERVILIRLGQDRVVNEDLVTDFSREIEAVQMLEKVALVFEIDSGGGSVDSARAIVDLIRSYRESDRLRIFAYVPNKAFSAAAWIALACRGLLIAPGALIGDIQPLIRDFRGFDRAPEKIVTALTEELRLTCQNNGLRRRYPRLFLEAMVDKDVEIVRVENRKLASIDFLRAEDWATKTEQEREGLSSTTLGLPGKALTTNGAELLDFGFSVKILPGPHEKLIDILGTPEAQLEIKEIKTKSNFEFPEFDWSLLLLVAGIVGIVMELKSPGLGIFGLGGLAAFVLFFLVRSGWTDAAIWPLGLFLVGAFLVILEAVILPGFIVPGLLGFLLILFATWSAIAHPGETSLPPLPNFSNEQDAAAIRIWATTLGGGIVAGFTFTLTLGKMLHRLPIFRRLVLLPPKGLHADPVVASPDATAQASSPQGFAQLAVGSRGITLTPLNPSGAGRFDGRRIDVVTRSRYIDIGLAIEVIEVAGNRIVVREAKKEVTS